MNTEYEVRILEIDVGDLEKRLIKLGAVYKGEFNQKRYVYDVKPKKEGKWIRLRKANDETTLTIKDITSDKIDGTKELEIKVDNFEKTNLLLEELGYISKSYQENKRERYILDGTEIDIDSWPLIPTYVEVEGKSEDEVKNIVKKLGYDTNDMVTLSVNDVYRKYGYELDDIKELKFKEE